MFYVQPNRKEIFLMLLVKAMALEYTADYYH